MGKEDEHAIACAKDRLLNLEDKYKHSYLSKLLSRLLSGQQGDCLLAYKEWLEHSIKEAELITDSVEYNFYKTKEI